MIRQRKLTTERTVIKETLPLKGVREAGSKDLVMIFIIYS